MKTLRSVMLGLGVASMGLSGCAERPGKKKDDDKEAKGDKDGDKGKAKTKAKADEKKK